MGKDCPKKEHRFVAALMDSCKDDDSNKRDDNDKPSWCKNNKPKEAAAVKALMDDCSDHSGDTQNSDMPANCPGPKMVAELMDSCKDDDSNKKDDNDKPSWCKSYKPKTLDSLMDD